MGKTVAVYDTKDVAFTLNGADVSLDLGEGQIEIERVESMNFRTSMSGVPLFSRKKEGLHAKLKVPFIKQAAANAMLNGFEKGGTYFSVGIVDMNTKDSYISVKSIVTNPASPKLGDDSDMEWEIVMTYMEPTVIGSDT